MPDAATFGSTLCDGEIGSILLPTGKGIDHNVNIEKKIHGAYRSSRKAKAAIRSAALADRGGNSSSGG